MITVNYGNYSIEIPIPEECEGYRAEDNSVEQTLTLIIIELHKRLSILENK